LTAGCSQANSFLDKGLSNQYNFFQSSEKSDDEIDNEKYETKQLMPTLQRREWHRTDGVKITFDPFSLAQYKFNGWRIGPYFESPRSIAITYSSLFISQ
tara:strand:- start:1773 stop:2069 length:297 start_codon:yes stop_codon:yes gene_type:complete